MTVMAPTERRLVRRAPSSGDPRASPYYPLLELVDEETRLLFESLCRDEEGISRDDGEEQYLSLRLNEPLRTREFVRGTGETRLVVVL